MCMFFINLHHTLAAKKANALLATIRFTAQNSAFHTHQQHLSACPSVAASTEFAYVAMLSKDFHEYGLSAAKLGHTLRHFSTLDMIMFELYGKPIPSETRDLLSRSGWKICMVQPINGPTAVPKDENRFLQASVYSKLHAWRLTEYKAVTLLDLDTIAIQDPSDLFTTHLPQMLAENKTLGAVREHPLTTCYGQGAWNTFNAGVLLIVPDANMFVRLIHSINLFPHNSAFDAEQALLNGLFKNSIFELSVAYNALTLIHTCEPELWYNQHHNFKIIHYTVTKPWTYSMRWRSIEDPFMCWFWKAEEYCMLWDMIDPHYGI